MRLSLMVLAALLFGAPVAVSQVARDERRSDSVMMSDSVKAMQAEDSANPGMLSVLDGEALWEARPVGAAPSCAGCHGDARTSMRGAAARYPAWSERRGGPIDLSGQIEFCRTTRQAAPPREADSAERLALTAFVAHLSRGEPIAPPADPRMAASRERGRQLFTARMGQLNLSCAQCHEQRAGQSLAGTAIPQAHPVGYPIYRLEWQSVGSLQRRFRNCMSGVRAEPFAYDAPEFIDLEAYLMQRAAGLTLETPAVRP